MSQISRVLLVEYYLVSFSYLIETSIGARITSQVRLAPFSNKYKMPFYQGTKWGRQFTYWYGPGKINTNEGYSKLLASFNIGQSHNFAIGKEDHILLLLMNRWLWRCIKPRGNIKREVKSNISLNTSTSSCVCYTTFTIIICILMFPNSSNYFVLTYMTIRSTYF